MPRSPVSLWGHSINTTTFTVGNYPILRCDAPQLIRGIARKKIHTKSNLFLFIDARGHIEKSVKYKYPELENKINKPMYVTDQFSFF